MTGAASGIGKACAAALLKRGMAVVGLDRDPAVKTAFLRGEYLGLVCESNDPAQIAEALEQTVRRFGGLDVLVLTPARDVHAEFDAPAERVAACSLKLSPRGARLVVLSAEDVDMAAWAGAGVRANAAHVRDTSAEVLAAAAEMAAEMCGPLFARTTLAQVRVDLSPEAVRYAAMVLATLKRAIPEPAQRNRKPPSQCDVGRGLLTAPVASTQTV